MKIEGRKRIVADHEIFLLAKALDVTPATLMPCKINVREVIPSTDMNKFDE